MGRSIHPVLGAAAAVLAGGLAVAQPPRLLPPVDQFGPVAGPNAPLDMPAEPAPGWMFEESDRVFELQLEGTLAAVGAETLRVERAAEPDAILHLRPGTLFYVEGVPATRDQLPEGAKVRAVFDLEGNRRIATRIDVPGEGEAAPEPTGPPPVSPDLPGAPDAD